MKLAEALIERADIKTKIEMLRMRMINNAKIQEGTNPNEEPKALLKELDEKLERMEYLIKHINKTNELTKAQDGKTISEMIAEKDVLSKKLSILGSYIDSASATTTRLTHTEIKILSAFSIADMQKQIDKLSKTLRELDTKIQELNWLTELI
jgi:valyl-tRNA synthetase